MRRNTCAEIDENVQQKHGVRDEIEYEQTGVTHVLVEEGNAYGQNDDVGDEQYEHDQVPVEAEVAARVDDPVADLLLAQFFLLKQCQDKKGLFKLSKLGHLHCIKVRYGL